MDLRPPLIEALLVLGPWVVLGVTFAATLFITGLVVPALPTIRTGCLLALQGHFSLSGVIAGVAIGGAVGDSTGYWIGRRDGQRRLVGEGRVLAPVLCAWALPEVRGIRKGAPPMVPETQPRVC